MENRITPDELAALLDHKPATGRPVDLNDLATRPACGDPHHRHTGPCQIYSHTTEQSPGAGLGSSRRAQDEQLSTLATLVAAVEREAARDGVVFVDAEAAREAEAAYDAALEGLRAELRCRRQLVHADPLVQAVGEYGDMRAQAVGEYGDMRAQAVSEGECGSSVDADLIEARAELVRDEIAAAIRQLTTILDGYRRVVAATRALELALRGLSLPCEPRALLAQLGEVLRVFPRDEDALETALGPLDATARGAELSTSEADQ